MKEQSLSITGGWFKQSPSTALWFPPAGMQWKKLIKRFRAECFTMTCSSWAHFWCPRPRGAIYLHSLKSTGFSSHTCTCTCKVIVQPIFLAPFSLAFNSTVKVIIRNFLSRCNEWNFELKLQMQKSFICTLYDQLSTTIFYSVYWVLFFFSFLLPPKCWWWKLDKIDSNRVGHDVQMFHSVCSQNNFITDNWFLFHRNKLCDYDTVMIGMFFAPSLSSLLCGETRCNNFLETSELF